MKTIDLIPKPFPHIIFTDYFTEDQLKDIWEELIFLSKPDKLFEPGIHHGAGGKGGSTNSRAVCLEESYRIYSLSNILKIYDTILLEPEINQAIQEWATYLRLKFIERKITKVRYYHNGDKYDRHTDYRQDFLLFSYFNKEPKKFNGGEVYFPEYEYQFECNNNSLIIFPGYIEHEVKEVFIEDNDYWAGNGRYCISQFLSIEPRHPDNYIKNA